MKPVTFLRIIIVTCAVAASDMHAQTNSILLYSPTNVRLSATGTGFGSDRKSVV